AGELAQDRLAVAGSSCRGARRRLGSHRVPRRSHRQGSPIMSPGTRWWRAGGDQSDTRHLVQGPGVGETWTVPDALESGPRSRSGRVDGPGEPTAVRRVRLPADRRTPAAARAVVRGVIEETGMPELLDAAVLLTTELSTNAVLHARTDLE